MRGRRRWWEYIKILPRLRVRARAQAKFRCEFKPITSPFSLLPPSFAPDVHHGGFWGDTAWFSVGVQNHQSEKWMNNIVLSIAPSPDVELVESNAGDHSIAPGMIGEGKGEREGGEEEVKETQR